MSSKNVTDFPTTIVSCILKRLDTKSFLACRQVCKKWQQIADDITNNSNVWRGFCEKDKEDVFKDVEDKSNMSWFHVYRNICSWSKLAYARRTETCVPIGSTLRRVLSVDVTKEGVLNATYRDLINFYDIMLMEEVLEPVHGSFINFQENQYGKITYRWDESLQVISKCQKEDSSVDYVLEDIELFCLDRFYCYCITNCRTLLRYDLRCLGAEPVTIHWKESKSDENQIFNVWREELHCLTNAGRILELIDYNLVPIGKVKFPVDEDTNIINNYYLFGDIYFLQSTYPLLYVQLKDGRHSSGTFPQVTSLLYHAHMLILGTLMGQMFVFDCRDEKKLLTLKKEDAIAMWEVFQGSVMTNPIISLAIYEYDEGHKIIAGTKQSIYILDYNHFSQ